MAERKKEFSRNGGSPGFAYCFSKWPVFWYDTYLFLPEKKAIVQQTNHPTYCFTSTCNSSSKITALYAEAAVIADHWPQPHRHRESILLSWSRAGVIGTIANFLPSPQNGNQSSCPIAADEGNLHEHKRLQAKSRKPRYEHEVTEWQCRDQSRYLFASRCNIRTSC